MAKQLAYLLLGSNLGDRIRIMDRALEMLQASIGRAGTISSRYETAAWGKADQPAFLNQAVGFEIDLSPFSLLEICQQTEQALAPPKRESWGARHIDIDILLYGEMVVEEDRLAIPHRWLALRRFALAPLAEIAPDFVHPLSGISVKELLAVCPDELEVRIFDGKS